MTANMIGLSRLIVVDIMESRLRLARELGATHVIDGHSEGVADQVRDVTAGGVDCALGTTGNQGVIRGAADSLRIRGTLGILGMSLHCTGLGIAEPSISG
jgi:aryl-alcohol dehydrogenase